MIAVAQLHEENSLNGGSSKEWGLLSHIYSLKEGKEKTQRREGRKSKFLRQGPPASY